MRPTRRALVPFALAGRRACDGAGRQPRRLGPTSAVVRTNRITPPDVVIKTVWERTGDRPFARIEDVMSRDELMALVDRYKQVAGYDRAALAR